MGFPTRNSTRAHRACWPSSLLRLACTAPSSTAACCPLTRISSDSTTAFISWPPTFLRSLGFTAVLTVTLFVGENVVELAIALLPNGDGRSFFAMRMIFCHPDRPQRCDHRIWSTILTDKGPFIAFSLNRPQRADPELARNPAQCARIGDRSHRMANARDLHRRLSCMTSDDLPGSDRCFPHR